ncbi:MAG: DHH family phosphoesterase [Candidatus Heimdallarchaeota archaeon]|nr:MAG: DHH family phosphoesterase [Candidatus Heimdallarchaeota archaeon]
MTKETSFFEACHLIAEDIQETVDTFPIHLFSHFDADGLAAASILASTFFQEGFNFQLRILERLEYVTLNSIMKKVPQGSSVIFTDIGTGLIDGFQQWKDSHKIFVLDHHSLPLDLDLSEDIRHLNPHNHSINGATELSGAGVAYFVSIQINSQNKYLSPLALIGALGDRQDQGEYSSLIGLNKTIVEDAKKLELVSDDVSVWFYDRTRTLISVLRQADYLGFENELEIRAFLERLEIPFRTEKGLRTFYELNEEENRRLASELILYCDVDPSEIYKRDYCLINEELEFLRDARVFVTKLNACGKTQRSDVGISLCLGDRHTALRDLQIIEDEYSKMIAQGLNWALTEGYLKELTGIYFLDGRKSINERIIGTIVSVLSSRKNQSQKPVLGCALTTTGRIKVSMRVSRYLNKQIDLSQILNQVIDRVEPDSEVGGHAAAAGAIISEISLEDFVSQVNQLALEGR